MTEIANHTFKDASQLLGLHLAYNNITKITEFSFAGADNLISLNLEDNKIMEVSSKAFNCVPHLKSLKLGNNQISTLDKETFAMLKNLMVLRLTSNPLVYIDPHMFVHNGRLSELGLSELACNELELELRSENIKKLDIYGMHADFKKVHLKSSESTDIIEIDELKLKYNRFTNLTQVNIDDTIHVKTLDLTQSKFEALEEAPDFLKHAKTLVFDSNSIQEIHQNFLVRIENVESLDLSGNRIRMYSNMFEPLKNLKELYLRGNNFGTVEPRWFSGLTKLENLNIGANNLSEFDYISLVNTLPSLKILNIQGGESDFKCGYLKKMVKDMKAIHRLDVIDFLQGQEERENFIYDIRCEKDSN